MEYTPQQIHALLQPGTGPVNLQQPQTPLTNPDYAHADAPVSALTQGLKDPNIVTRGDLDDGIVEESIVDMSEKEFEALLQKVRAASQKGSGTGLMTQQAQPSGLMVSPKV